MKNDLKNMTRRQLERLRADIDKALERLADSEKKEALKAAEKAVRAFGFSLDQITGGMVKAPAEKTPAAKKPSRAKAAKTGDGRAKVAPKFCNPENPDETWTGRGRAPKWVVAHLAAGGAKEDLAI